MSSLDDAIRNTKNPLKQGLPLSSDNIFIDIINFAMEHNKEILYTILCLTSGNVGEFDVSYVIFVAKLYMGISSRLNKSNTVYMKLQGIFLQSCGLTDVGIDALAKLGETVTSRSLLDTRTGLAIKDEDYIREISKSFTTAMVLDNLDRSVKKVVQHQTLPMILSRKVPNLDELDTTRKSLEEAMLNFNLDFFV